MKLLVHISLLFSLSMLISCVEDLDGSNTEAADSSKVQRSSWNVEYAWLGEEEQSLRVYPLQIKFKEGGDLGGEYRGRKVKGSWEKVVADGEECIDLEFIGINNLEYLNHPWRILAQSTDFIYLSYTDKEQNEQILKLQRP
jgi:hypothetical protein